MRDESSKRKGCGLKGPVMEVAQDNWSPQRMGTLGNRGWSMMRVRDSEASGPATDRHCHPEEVSAG